MLKTRLSAFLSLLVVFLSGAVLGGFGYRFYLHQYPPTPVFRQPPTAEQIRNLRNHIVSDMKKAVNLDDQQVTALQKILDDVRAQGDDLHNAMQDKLHKIRDHQVDEIKSILRPEQEPLYDKWLQERQLERQKRMQEKGEKGGFRQDK